MGLLIPPTHMLMSALGPKRLRIELKPTAPSGEIRLPNTFELFRVLTNEPGRFRLYRNTADIALDTPRPPERDPEPANGLLTDLVFTLDRLNLDLSPIVTGSPKSPDTYCAWSWTGPLTATLTLELLQVEAIQ